MNYTAINRWAQRQKTVITIVFLSTMGLVFLQSNHHVNNENEDYKGIEKEVKKTYYKPVELRKEPDDNNGGIEIVGNEKYLESILASNYVESILMMKLGGFTPPKNVKNSPGKKWVVLGMLVLGLQDGNFAARVTHTLEGMLEHFSGSHLHLVVVTDMQTRDMVGQHLARILTRWVSFGAIQASTWRWRRQRGLPHIHLSLVDIEAVIEEDRMLINDAKMITSETLRSSESKYMKDLFYISPLYPKAFSSLDRMVFIDMDIDFYGDLMLLWLQFEEMPPGKVVAMARDLSPHYWTYLGDYRKANPSTSLGQPGPLQGLNTGVVLFRLDLMRQSSLFTSQLNSQSMEALSKEYKMTFETGDQDWWSFLSWKFPELFYILPCRFNKQMSLQYLRWPYEEMFDSYHNCSSTKSQTIIFHRNGCGPTPMACFYNPFEDSDYWKTHTNGSYRWEVHTDVELFWYMMGEKDTYIHKGTINMLLDGKIFLPNGALG